MYILIFFLHDDEWAKCLQTKSSLSPAFCSKSWASAFDPHKTSKKHWFWQQRLQPFPFKTFMFYCKKIHLECKGAFSLFLCIIKPFISKVMAVSEGFFEGTERDIKALCSQMIIAGAEKWQLWQRAGRKSICCAFSQHLLSGGSYGQLQRTQPSSASGDILVCIKNKTF